MCLSLSRWSVTVAFTCHSAYPAVRPITSPSLPFASFPIFPSLPLPSLCPLTAPHPTLSPLVPPPLPPALAASFEVQLQWGRENMPCKDTPLFVEIGE